MGLFTSVYGPQGEVQIKHGDDFCDSARIGEPFRPGLGIPPDGIYDGINGPPWTYWLVVVKGSIPVAVVPSDAPELFDPGCKATPEAEAAHAAQVAELEAAHGVKWQG